MSKFQPFFSLKQPKVRPFLEFLSQAFPKVPEIKFTRFTWIFKKSSQLPCLLMSLWDLKNASVCIVWWSNYYFVRLGIKQRDSDTMAWLLGIPNCSLTLIGMRQGGFTPLIIFGLDFVSWIFIKNFQTFLEVKIEIN